MHLELQSMLEYGLSTSLDVINLGFSDYLVPIQLDLPHFFDLLRTAHVDINLSQIVVSEQGALGAALVARRGWSSRLAGMSIIPEARGKKVGQWLMEQLINHARQRGDRRMELEVIEQNEPAVKLYRKIGFQTMRRLESYRLENPMGIAAELTEIDIRELADRINLYGLPHLPWQLSGENLAANGLPQRAFRLDSAYVSISDPNAETIVLRSLLTLPQDRNHGQASSLMKALFAQFPGKAWVVPAIFPQEIGTFFERLGFERQKLSQFQMELILQER